MQIRLRQSSGVTTRALGDPLRADDKDVSTVSPAPPVMYLAVETFLGGYHPGRRGSRESDQR